MALCQLSSSAALWYGRQTWSKSCERRSQFLYVYTLISCEGYLLTMPRLRFSKPLRIGIPFSKIALQAVNTRMFKVGTQCQQSRLNKLTLHGASAIYRHNTSADHIGVFDAALIDGLPDSVKVIAHNGAGYDQIDIAACTKRCKSPCSCLGERGIPLNPVRQPSKFRIRQALSTTLQQRPQCF